MKTINKISFARLSNAYHVSFLFAIKADIDKYDFFEDGAPAIGIQKNLYDAYVEQLEKEQDIVNRTRSSEYTPVLAKLDKARDAYYRRLYYKLKIAEGDSMNEKITSELINVIQERLLKPYPLSIVSDANHKQTAKVRGFVKDIKTWLKEEQIEMLSIADDLAQLEAVNDEYERTYVLRSSNKAHNADTGECRLASEKLYINVILSIQTIANAIFDSKDYASASKAALCNNCIDDINQLIKEFKQKAYPNGTAEDDEEEDNEDVNVNENSSENIVNAEKENVSVNAD